MKYIVNSALLYSRLQNIERVISPKNSIQIMSCFLCDIKAGNMEITASDGDTTLKTSIELQEATGDCRFALEAKRFMGILKEIPEQPLTLDINSSTLQIDLVYQNGHFAFQGEPADDYPQKAAITEEGTSIQVDAASFAKGISTALIAAATNESRKVMSGVLVDMVPGAIAIVASDGKKLIRYMISGDIPEMGSSFTLPQKPASILKSILEKENGDATIITFASFSAIIKTENYTMDCRLFEERYPNYKSVIPTTNNNVATIDLASFISAMRRALVVADKTTSLVKISFETGKVTITAEDINYATSAEEKLVCQYEGMSMKIGFKGTDLLELLGNIPSKEFYMKLTDNSRAGLIMPTEQKEGTDLLMLLMPLLINN